MIRRAIVAQMGKSVVNHQHHKELMKLDNILIINLLVATEEEASNQSAASDAGGIGVGGESNSEEWGNCKFSLVITQRHDFSALFDTLYSSSAYL